MFRRLRAVFKQTTNGQVGSLNSSSSCVFPPNPFHSFHTHLIPMKPTISVNSTRRLAVSSGPAARRVFSHHVGHASGTYNAALTHTANKLPIRCLSYTPISRNDVQGPTGKLRVQEKVAASDNGEEVKPLEVPVPPAVPSAGGSGGGQFTTGSGAVDTLLATAVGLGMSKSYRRWSYGQPCRI